MSRPPFVFPLPLLAIALAGCAQAEPDDTTSGVTASTSESESGAGDTGTTSTDESGDTETGDDLYAECADYCVVWLDCTEVYEDLDACEFACMASIDNAAFAGIECMNATKALFACIGALDCAALETIDTAGGACEVEDAMVSAACG